MVSKNDFTRHPLELELNKIAFGGFEGKDYFVMIVDGREFAEFGIMHGDFIICEKAGETEVGEVAVVEWDKPPYRKLKVIDNKKEGIIARIVMTGRLFH